MTFPRAPETEEEQEALEAIPDGEVCTEQQIFYCTRRIDHVGLHVAGDEDGEICAVWDSK